jgi:hypothetical protein
MINFICSCFFSEKITKLILEFSENFKVRLLAGILIAYALYMLSSQGVKMFVLSVLTSGYMIMFLKDVWVDRRYSFIAKDLCEALGLSRDSNEAKFVFLINYLISSISLILVTILN